MIYMSPSHVIEVELAASKIHSSLCSSTNIRSRSTGHGVCGIMPVQNIIDDDCEDSFIDSGSIEDNENTKTYAVSCDKSASINGHSTDDDNQSSTSHVILDSVDAGITRNPGVSSYDGENETIDFGLMEAHLRQAKYTNCDDQLKVNWHKLFFKMNACLLFVADMVFDVYLATGYFLEDMPSFGAITTFFFACPSLVVFLLGVHWYHMDYVKVSDSSSLRTPAYLWPVRFISTCLLLGPLWRRIEYIINGIRAKLTKDENEKRKYVDKLVSEELDISFLNLIESFLEAAPQLVFQLYALSILRPMDNDIISGVWRWTKMGVSLLSLSVSLTSYHSALRKSIPWKHNLEVLNYVVYCFWRCCEISTRIACIAYLSTVLKTWVLIPLAVHWIGVTVCNINCRHVRFYENSIYDNLFKCLLGYVMIFSFVNISEGASRVRMHIFYVLFYTENICMCCVGMVYNYFRWSYLLVIPACLHIIFLYVYYQYCHPNNTCCKEEPRRHSPQSTLNK